MTELDFIDVIVEIPAGSRNKYEYDHKRHLIRLDRVLFSSVHYPADYGFVPETLEPDGDPLDVLIIVHEPTFPGCLVEVRPVGCLDMRDEKGQDHKIVGIPLGDPRFSDVQSLDDLPSHWQREIENFFATYKRLEDKNTEIIGWHGPKFAARVIDAARQRYQAQNPSI